MLVIRFKPIGKTHNKRYRIVVAQKSKHVSKSSIEDLGWYNPYTKEGKVNQERLDYYKTNAEISPSVQSFLKRSTPESSPAPKATKTPKAVSKTS